MEREMVQGINQRSRKKNATILQFKRGKKGLEKCDGSWYREEDDDKMEQNTVRKADKPLPMVTGKKRGRAHTKVE